MRNKKSLRSRVTVFFLKKTTLINFRVVLFFVKKFKKYLQGINIILYICIVKQKQITLKMDFTWYNKNFRIVFEPKDKTKFNNNRRFGVGAGRLADYIGESNAAYCFRESEKIKKDKKRFIFRETGIVDFYCI